MPLNGIVPPAFSEVDKAVAIVRNQSHWPIYVHCDHGDIVQDLSSERAYRVLVQGWPPQKAYEEMKAMGYSGFPYNLLGWDDAFFEYIRSRGSTKGTHVSPLM